MSYETCVRIALKADDYAKLAEAMHIEFSQGLKKQESVNADNWLMEHQHFHESNGKYTVFGWDWVKWVDSYDFPDLLAIKKFLHTHDCVLATFGEFLEDLNVEENDVTQDGKVEEMREILDIRREFSVHLEKGV